VAAQTPSTSALESRPSSVTPPTIALRTSGDGLPATSDCVAPSSP
jgi:hypothetical protein